MNLSNMRIGARLALGFAVTIVIMFIMSLVGISRIQEVAGRTDQLVNDRYVKVTLLNDMRSQVNRGARKGVPSIGDGVYIGPGAVIIGGGSIFGAVVGRAVLQVADIPSAREPSDIVSAD